MAKEKPKKPWYKSNTKKAAILTGISLMLPSIANWMNGGTLDWDGLWQGATVILGAVGLYDFVDRKVPDKK